MSQSKLRQIFVITFATTLLIATPLQSCAANKNKVNKEQSSKERLVLMPLRLSEEDKNLQGAMETALVKGLQRKYEVFSGEQVAKKAREIFLKESRNTAHTECDEIRCLQGIAEAFQAELLATANITKQDGGYFIALSIQNLYDNKVVQSESVACEGCNAFKVIDKLKEIVGAPVPVASAPAIEEILPGKIFKDCVDCPAMIRIPGKNYEMGKYDVTQAEWRAVMGNNPSKFTSCGDTCPVEQVNWSDLQEYLKKINAKSGRHYRLPTEEEWEYACYGGSQTEYCGGSNLDNVAWYIDNSNGTTHPVGQKLANGYGLFDMSGHVWQWMQNKYDNEHDWRALRGGSWTTYSKYLRATYRYNVDFGPSDRLNLNHGDFGFRLARTLP